MQIAILHFAAPPIVGGVESVMASHARLIAAAGDQVRIFAGRGKTLDACCPVEILPLIDSRHPRVMKNKASLDGGKVPGDFEPLVEQIQNELERSLTGYDLIIAHNVASLNKNLALTAALYKMSQKPDFPRLINWHHDLAWTTSRYQPELYDGYPWDLLRTAWPNVTQVVVSEERKKEYCALTRLPANLVHVIPAGVDMPEFLNLNQQVRGLASQLNLYEASPILLAPVRVTKRKNLELAIETTAHLREHMPGAALVVTGPLGAHNPANVDYLKKLVTLRKMLGMEGSVHLMAEHVPDGLETDSVAGFYRLADAMLLPSREEGFGIPVLEAGIARIPIFCSNLQPLKALAGPWAQYFKPNEKPGKIAQMILQSLTDNVAYNLRVQIRSLYTWNAIYHSRMTPLFIKAISHANRK